MKVHALLLGVVSPLLLASPAFSQGSLAPPGPPAPTMKSLDQVEPRTPISSLPYTISAPGSYYLTQNLTASGDSEGITVSADDVTIDLAGFALDGGGVGRNGIIAPAAQNNLCVRNGTISRWTSAGVAAITVSTGLYEKLRVIGNSNITFPGLDVGERSSVIACVATDNKASAIRTRSGCLVSQCTATNSGSGIVVVDNSAVLHCTASDNHSAGIVANDGSTIADCTASGNFDGIFVHFGCTVRGCTVRANSAIGIYTANGSYIVDNIADLNNGSQNSNSGGVYVSGTGNRVDSNSITANGYAGLQAPKGGNIIIRNSFLGALYIADPGNSIGPLVDMTSGGTITSNSPWANFHYSN